MVLGVMTPKDPVVGDVQPVHEEVLRTRFRGKTALVVGATRGIGRGTALALASAGASVSIVGRSRRNGDKAVAEMAAIAPFKPEQELKAYSKDHNDRTPSLTFRTYRILPHTNSYFHCLCSYLDLLQELLGYQGGSAPLGYPWDPGGEGLDSCKDSESSC